MKPLIPLIMASAFTGSVFAADEPEVIIPVLKIEQQVYLTDRHGLASPENIIRVKPLDNVKIFLSDGTELNGIVTKTEEFNKELFKVFGDIQNKDNAGFGFVLAKEGIFAGAVVFRNTDEVYKLEYSEEAKGFMLVKSIQKKPIKISKNKSLTNQKPVL